MANDHVKRIEGLLKDLRGELGKVSAPAPFEEFLKVIHRPGWTTPAEFALVTGLLDGMITTARALEQMKAALVRGAGDVRTTG